jgi:hypothetical protein
MYCPVFLLRRPGQSRTFRGSGKYIWWITYTGRGTDRLRRGHGNGAPDVVVADYIQNTFGVQPRPLDPVTIAKDHEGMTNLQREAAIPIYRGSIVNRLAIVMELLKVQARNPTMTNQCVDDVLRMINTFIIDPKLDNKMPKTRYEARKIVSDMGLDYVSIHACPCDGMLYYGPNAELTEYRIEGCGL